MPSIADYVARQSKGPFSQADYIEWQSMLALVLLLALVVFVATMLPLPFGLLAAPLVGVLFHPFLVPLL